MLKKPPIYLPRYAGMLILSLLLGACEDSEPKFYQPVFGDAPAIAYTEYVFGVHPLHNPQRLHENFAPLMDYLSRQVMHSRFRLEASRNYAHYDRKLVERSFHFALPNPYQTVMSLQHGYRIIAKMGDDHNFRGIILTRRDRHIENVAQLRGKAVSFPAPTALAATMMPQLFLQELGLDVHDELDIRYVGSQESSIMNVYYGDTIAGATWPPPWQALSKEKPELAEALEVTWQTASLPNNGVIVRDDVPRAVADKVRQLLASLHQHEEGIQILHKLELSRFELADNDTYQPVHDFLERFQREVNPLEAFGQ